MLLKFKRGLAANLAALSGSYNVGEPYFTTDTGRYFIAKTNSVLVEYPDLAAVTAAISTSLTSANSYTDGKIADLVNLAPTTMDTLKEIADYVSVSGEGSVAAAITNSITTAKNELKGSVTTAFDTLGEVEVKLNSLQTAVDNNTSNTNTAIQAAIAQEVSDRNAAILVETNARIAAINQEVSDRNAAIAAAVAVIDGGTF